MTKKEMDKLRASILYEDEELYVVCTANYGNFPKGIPLKAKPRMTKKSGLPYPEPKWEACCKYEKTIYELNEDNKMKTDRIDHLQRALVGEEKLKAAIKALAVLI